MVQVVDAGISIYDDDDLGKRGRDEKKDRRDRGRDGDRRRDERDGGRREERRGRLGFSKFIQNIVRVSLSGMSAKTNTEGRDIGIEMIEKTGIGKIDMEGRTETGMRDRLEQVRSQCLTSTSLPSHWRKRREASQQKIRS